MKARTFASLGRALAVCLLSALAASAQESPQAPQRKPDKLVVQVVYKKGARPSYQEVPGGAWYALFGTTPASTARAAADAVRAVDVKTTLDEGRVVLKVGVHVGERFFDRFEEVATYRAAAGETVEAHELERVGVAPFVFKVLRVNASDTAAPVVSNLTQSVAAVVTDFTPDPLPRAKVTLTNLSEKRVRAVMLKTTADGRARTSMLVAEREGKILMEPGATYERKFGFTDGRRDGANFTPQNIDGVLVAAVVFEDYTFEGDVDSASLKATFDEGERLQLARVVQLVRAAHDAGDAEAAEAVGKFRAAVAALDDAAPQSSVDGLRAAYPGLTRAISQNVKAGVEVSMHRVRSGLLADLEVFVKRYEAAPADHSFKSWLAEQQARLEAWLARL